MLVRAVYAGEQGEPEREGLPGPGGGPAEDVPAVERVRDRRSLDGERVGDVALCKCVDELLG